MLTCVLYSILEILAHELHRMFLFIYFSLFTVDIFPATFYEELKVCPSCIYMPIFYTEI